MIILIDNGHGIDTNGKCSPILTNVGFEIDPKFTDGGRFREWKYNRVISNELVKRLKDLGYDARLIVTEEKDISLTARANRVNKVCAQNGASNVILISIHANACGNGAWMHCKGWCAYTTKGVTKSDKLATVLYDKAKENFKGRRLIQDMTDGDADMEANFTIIKKSNCPAVLTENFFYDNKEDLQYLTSKEGVESVIKTHIEGILEYMGVKATKSKTMADYKKLIPFIKKWEGGYANHPNDRGGCTNSGVTISTYRTFYGSKKTCEDLKKMTDDQWEHIFKTGFWDRWKADQIENQSIANLVVDWVWASGVHGIKYPQEVLGVYPDGIVGPKTLKAINDYPNQKELFQKLWDRRKKHFEDIVKKSPSQKVFLKGWLRRISDLKYED